MNKVYIWFAVPALFLVALFLAVRQTPDFITVNFMFVWFAMVLTVVGAALGILWSGLQGSGKDKETEPHGPAESSHD